MNTFIAAGMVALLTQVPGSGRPITLNFYKTDVAKIFRAISMRADVNIIYSGSVDLPVTIDFSAVNADEAIRGTTASAGLSFRRVGNIYVVAKPDALKQAVAPFASRYRIKTPAASAELAKSIQDLLPQATVVAGEGELIVNGIPDDYRLAQELVRESVDESDRDIRHAEIVSLGTAQTKQVVAVLTDLYPKVRVTVLSDATGGGGTLALVGPDSDVSGAKAKVLELDEATPNATASYVAQTYVARYASVKTLSDFLKDAAPDVTVTIAPPSQVPDRLMTILGSVTATGGSTGGSGGGASGGAAPPPNTAGGAVGGTGTGATGANYDKSTRLVLRGRKSDVTNALDLLKEVDTRPQEVMVEVRIVDVSPEVIQQTGINYSWQPFTLGEASPGTSVGSIGSVTKPMNLGLLSRSPINVTATIDAMIQHNDAKLLASPSMAVVNNEEANFFVGDQLSYPVSSSGALGATNTTIQTYNIGIGLNIRPHVNADGNITLRLNPIVQTLTGTLNGLPQTASREANTIVIVKDGQSIVIGGLIEDQDQKTINEIPLLSQLPIVGQLFRHTNRDHLKSNIVVSVTPHIVKPAETTQ